MIDNKKFERHMRDENLSENTISSYLFAVNHKVIFDYLFKSSYMPVQPIVTGFSGIFRYGRYSQIFLYPRMFWCSKVVCGVVNSPFTTYAISRFISVIDVSEVVCA